MQYTPEQRAEALAILTEHGKAVASERTGIPEGTIASWGSRTGVAAPPAERTAKATAKRVATIAERKAKLAEALMGDAERMRVGVTKFEPLDRKRNVEAVAKAVEVVQLLTGEATERIEQIGGGSTVEAAKAVLADVKERHLKAVG
jgi:hypothetical protein